MMRGMTLNANATLPPIRRGDLYRIGGRRGKRKPGSVPPGMSPSPVELACCRCGARYAGSSDGRAGRRCFRDGARLLPVSPQD